MSCEAARKRFCFNNKRENRGLFSQSRVSLLPIFLTSAPLPSPSDRCATDQRPIKTKPCMVRRPLPFRPPSLPRFTRLDARHAHRGLNLLLLLLLLLLGQLLALFCSVCFCSSTPKSSLAQSSPFGLTTSNRSFEQPNQPPSFLPFHNSPPFTPLPHPSRASSSVLSAH